MSTSRQTVVNLVKYLLAFSLLAYVIWSNWSPANGRGLQYVWEQHVIQGEPIQVQFLALAAVLGMASILLTFFRWYLLVRAVELPFRVVDAFRLGIIGFFFNTFLPGSVGGDIIKAAFLAREQNRRTVAVATVIMDRVIALWALVWFVAVLGCIFWAGGYLEGEAQSRSEIIVKIAMGVVGATLLVWALLGFLPQQRAERFASRLEALPKIGEGAAEFWRAVWMYRCKQRSVITAMVLAAISQSGFVLCFYFSARTLLDASQKIPTLAEHFLLVPIGLVIQAAVPFPGGAGIGELGFGELYRLFHCSEAAGVLGSLVQRLIFWVLGLFGYFVYLWMRPSLQPATKKDEELASVPP